MPWRFVLVPVALGLVLTLAGCSADSKPATPPVPGPVASPPVVPLPPAEDGDNVAACADGACEVRIAGPVALPVDGRFEVTALRVGGLGADQVMFEMSVAGGSVQSSGCRTSVQTATPSTPGSVKADCPPGGRLTLNKISLGVAAISQNTAVVRLMPR